MPEIDPNLIAALAEGILDAAQAAAAEAAIAADPRATAELTYQRAALSAIAAAPSVRLSDGERNSLRAAVAGAVNLELDPEPKPALSRRRSAPWGAIAVAAVSLTAIVAIVPMVGLLSTGDSGDGAAATVFDAARVTTVVSQAVDDLGATADETLAIGDEERRSTSPTEGEPSSTTTTTPAPAREAAEIAAAPTLPLTSESGLTTATATVSPGEGAPFAATGPEQRLKIASFSDADGAALYQAWVADPEAAADRPHECDIAANQQLGDEIELLVVPVEIGEIDPMSVLAYLAIAGDAVTDLIFVDGTTCLPITP